MTRTVVAQMEDEARRAAPRECCGFLAGRRGIGEIIYPLRNVAARPTVEYFADVRDVLEAFRTMRARGEELLGIYHSHPASAAYPSATDIERAYYPEAVYFIISLQPVLDLRAYRIISGKVEAVTIEVIEDA
ncbi:MAG: M67 family metallopeptidase [Blastocatellia bacterium]|nr:M67 family metallopeptidase [Blastocatellia bacterium]MCS7158188.1 M67 family metallopeptidase [Blastocatellia bacterium]MCX7752950.1 M67 family metallopeptidase [Blastocatellia bacterium]MDW8168473.1 M67 family metallopeptidase [Acidobacteriota bacterium]MDW8256887.1 M67 family metallopeptidase [Acidobacteriota bacterium]